MGKYSLGNVNRQATEEDEAEARRQYRTAGRKLGWNAQERNPGKVLEECAEESTMSEAVL